MVYFREKQTFDGWVYGLVFGSAAPILILYFFVPQRDWAVLTVAAVLPTFLLVGAASLLLLLQTEVTDKEIHAALGVGSGLMHKRIRLADIARHEVVTYNPMEYGGWGFKGWGGKSVVNARGDRGVRLWLHNGDEIVVGSQQPDSLHAAITEALREQV